MAKLGEGVRTALDDLREYAASLAPQRGMFSTLDELVKAAPFESAPAEQWQGYLKPGRMLKRGDLQFPLKQEELDYAVPELKDWHPEGVLQKDNLLKFIRERRPTFALQVGDESLTDLNRAAKSELPEGSPRQNAIAEYEQRLEDLAGEQPEYYSGSTRRLSVVDPKFGPREGDADWSRLSTQSPGSTYQESATRLHGINTAYQHFTGDTLSHSRTSSHDIPDVGKVRLIDEIQSDLHHRAASRLNWREGLDEDTRKEYNDLQNELARYDVPHPSDPMPLTEMDARANGIRDRISEIEKEGKENAPRRGYFTEQEQNEFDRLHDVSMGPAGLDPDQRRRFLALKQKLREGVPDAPFKDPAEYGRLEIKKQLINAAREGQDWLAITPPEMQIERYGMDNYVNPDGYQDQSAKGMQHVYGKIYPGEMSKLAKQYGAEMKDLEMPVGTVADAARTQLMREGGFENWSDVQSHFDQMDDDYMEHPVDILNMLNEAERHIKEMSQRGSIRSVSLMKRLGKFYDAYSAATASSGHESENWIKAKNQAIDPKEWERFVGDMAGETHDFMLVHSKVGEAEKRTFRAIRLTPEVRERILRHGTSLWARGGAVRMAKGGNVADVIRELRKRAEEVFADVGYRSSAMGHLDKYVHGEDLDKGELSSLNMLLNRGRLPRTSLWRSTNDLASRSPRGMDIMPEDLPISTSLYKDTADEFKSASRNLYKIYAPDNSRGLYLGHLPGSEHQNEMEVLLPGGAADFQKLHTFSGPNTRDNTRLLEAINDPHSTAGEEEYQQMLKDLEQLQDRATRWREAEIPDYVYKLKPRYGQGGDVEEDDAYRAASAQAYDDQAREMATHRAPQEGGFDPIAFAGSLPRHFYEALKEQWAALNDRSQAVPFYETGDVPAGQEPNIDPETGMILNAPATLHEPALIKNARTLPEQFFGDRGHPSQALQDLHEIHRQLMGDAGLEEPRGILQNLASAGGATVGQLPVPGGFFSKMAEKLPAVARILGYVPAKYLDFLGPTMHPSLGNYAAATGIGGMANALTEPRDRPPTPELTDDQLLDIEAKLAQMRMRDAER